MSILSFPGIYNLSYMEKGPLQTWFNQEYRDEEIVLITQGGGLNPGTKSLTSLLLEALRGDRQTHRKEKAIRRQKQRLEGCGHKLRTPGAARGWPGARRQLSPAGTLSPDFCPPGLWVKKHLWTLSHHQLVTVAAGSILQRRKTKIWQERST